MAEPARLTQHRAGVQAIALKTDGLFKERTLGDQPAGYQCLGGLASKTGIIQRDDRDPADSRTVLLPIHHPGLRVDGRGWE